MFFYLLKSNKTTSPDKVTTTSIVLPIIQLEHHSPIHVEVNAIIPIQGFDDQKVEDCQQPLDDVAKTTLESKVEVDVDKSVENQVIVTNNSLSPNDIPPINLLSQALKKQEEKHQAIIWAFTKQ